MVAQESDRRAVDGTEEASFKGFRLVRFEFSATTQKGWNALDDNAVRGTAEACA
jgi:hypothetical protein